jgi:hypothetical protein
MGRVVVDLFALPLHARASVLPHPRENRPLLSPSVFSLSSIVFEASSGYLRIAHEVGHVWVFTHHPYLQTEKLGESDRDARR